VVEEGILADQRDSFSKRAKQWADHNLFWVFFSPSLVFILFVCIFPLLYSFYLSFQLYELALPVPPAFAGFGNYLKAFQDSRFWSDFGRSFYYVFASGALQLIIGISVALVLDRDFRGRSVAVSLFLIPMVIAPVVVGFIWRMIYNERFGPLNFFLSQVGLPQIPWLSNPGMARVAVILSNAWEWAPFMMFAVLAALQSLPQDSLEAAQIDGASKFRVFWHIKLPLVSPVILAVFLIRAIEDFKLFDLLYVVVGRGGTPETETLNMYTYYVGFRFFSLGYASALSYIQLIVVFLLIRWLMKKLPVVSR